MEGKAYILDTERLSIRQLCPADAGFYLGLLNEPSFHEHIGDKGVRTLEDALEHLSQGPLNSYQKHGFGLYLVCLKPIPSTQQDMAETPIGICGVLKREELPLPDLGFAFKPAFWGKGYAFESAQALLVFEARRHELEQVLAITSPQNQASQSLLLKLGFVAEGEQVISEGAEPVSLFRWRA